jgi:hypothetical protein
MDQEVSMNAFTALRMADWSVLAPGQYLIHDRDGKYHILSILVVTS